MARHSFDTATTQSGLHIVSAWCNELSLCLGQVDTEQKSNEITAVPMLLDLMEIRAAVVTVDAMNCQRKTIAKICHKGADNNVTVKANQERLFEEAESRLMELGEENDPPRKCSKHSTTIKTRGRIEKRTVIVTQAPQHLREEGRWANIKSIGLIFRQRQHDPECPDSKPVPESNHVTYFISSLAAKAEALSSQVKDHWSVENTLHWSLDMAFREDESRVRKGSGQEIIGAFRRRALLVLRRDTSLKKESIRGKRYIASLDPKALEAIITSV